MNCNQRLRYFKVEYIVNLIVNKYNLGTQGGTKDDFRRKIISIKNK